MAVLDIAYEGRNYLLDLEDLDTDQAAAMERFGVSTLLAFEEGIGKGDVKSLTVCYWLCLQQNGEPGARLERVKFKPIKFLRALAEASKVAQEQATEDDSPKDTVE